MTDIAAEPISFAARLGQLAAGAPDAVALIAGGAAITRGALDTASTRIARSLRQRGVKAGELLTIGLPNGAGFIQTMIACWKLGVTPQPVSARLPQAELAAVARLAESRFVVGEPELACDLPTVTVEDLLGESQDATPLEDNVAPCWKAPTSGGSTGRPKLILSGQASLYTPDIGAVWKLTGADVVLMPGPLYHNGPFQIAAYALLRGAPLVLMAKFDAEEVLRAIAKHKASWVYLVPTMMNRIERLPADIRAHYDVSSLKTVWHLAAPCPAWLKRAWIDWLGADVVNELYGATEGQAATAISGAEWLAKPGSVGRVRIGEMKVVGADGRDLPPGAIGEIYLRQPPGPPTYTYRGATTEFLDGGWETVGDIGFIDAEGYVFLSDRRADMILVGGSNVYPAEVEAALEEYSGVQSSAVIGLPDDDLGNRIHAIIQGDPALDLDDLARHLAARLVRYKLPRSFEIVTQALRDDAGKVRRSELRAQRVAKSTA
jgi:bile acid-coenzyme A ligase